jgi:hypothetical protein
MLFSKNILLNLEGKKRKKKKKDWEKYERVKAASTK